MQENSYRFPQDIYFQDLKTIQDIPLTPREIDIIACLLHVRGTSKIASLLSLSPNTVLVHTRNLMVKLGYNSRDNIIDFIESSPKLPVLREYYISLKIEAAFTKTLKAISKLKIKENLAGAYIYWQDRSVKDALMDHLIRHLKHAGIHAVIKEVSKHPPLGMMEKSGQLIFFLLKKKAFQEMPQLLDGFKSVDITQKKNYYFSFFEIIEEIFPEVHSEGFYKSFTEQYYAMQSSLGSNLSKVFQENRTKDHEKQHLHKDVYNPKNKKLYLLAAALSSSILVGGFLMFKENKEMQVRQDHEGLKETSIRSDLFIPTQAVLLLRPDEITRIEGKFKEMKGIQALALVGPGGAGKTILTRQYAKEQKAKIIWEINAETYASLKSSFEDLAQALAITEKDQKILESFQDIKDLAKREKRLIGFVKKNLKSYPNWFLIYDNVKEFGDIQKYFPMDAETWGSGKIILTTRNSNIQSSKYINTAFQVEELTPHQKLILFMKIMTNGETVSFPKTQMEEAKNFLEKIPSYPLDVSIAAYYLKLTDIPYATYLENLAKNNNDFANIQEKVLEEVGDYTKTRYGIVTLSLQHLINTYKEFTGLILFMSLLDSQNIPRNLLGIYKGDVSVDNFVLTLKKYSLITSHAPTTSPWGSTLSMHRSTQEISLAYLRRILNLEKNHRVFEPIARSLEKYMVQIVEREDLSKLKLIVNHCEAFLSHKNLLSKEIKSAIRGELGGIYLYLGNYEKAKGLLEKSLRKQKAHGINLGKVRALAYLGNVYGDSGNYEKAQDLLEQSLTLYKQYFPKSYAGIARALSYLGNVNRDIGHYEKAKVFLEESHLIYKKYFPENHAGIARNAAYLGIVHTILGDYERAKDLLEQSLVTYQTHLSKNQAAKAWVIAHQGELYGLLGDNEKAKILFEQSIALYKEYYPEGHIKTGWALSALGDVYRILGNYKEAKDVLEQSLLIYKKHLSENHIVIAGILVYLGAVHKDLGEYEKAIDFIEKSFVIYNKHFPKDHSEVAWALAHLGDTYRAMGAYEKAQSLLEESVLIYKKHFSKSHRELSWALECLSKVYHAMGDNEKVKRLFE